MSVTVHHGASKAWEVTWRAFSQSTGKPARRCFGIAAQSRWVCADCRTQNRDGAVRGTARRITLDIPRSFTSVSRRSENLKALPQEPPRIPPSTTDGAPQTPASTSTSLPSHSEKQRWTASRRMSSLMDALLARASIASHQINNYTGTDFSGIEALRNEIIEQENEVRKRRAAVTGAKSRHTEAQEKQSTSQKEIVGLLERKSSWSPTDLERYMALVRSEHLDEQAEQKSREDLSSAEKELELCRSLLEKLERKQYHEEQIWSDTIRRNSTWVTMGLMGVNIILLLAQISIFEPYRRRKIVNQIKEALDEKTLASPELQAIEKEIDAVTASSGVTAGQLDTPITPVEVAGLQATSEDLLQADSGGGTTNPDGVATIKSSSHTGNTSLGIPNVGRIAAEKATIIQESVRDLFSDRIIQIQKRGVTTLALEGVVTGAAVATFLCLTILSPRR